MRAAAASHVSSSRALAHPPRGGERGRDRRAAPGARPPRPSTSPGATTDPPRTHDELAEPTDVVDDRGIPAPSACSSAPDWSSSAGRGRRRRSSRRHVAIAAVVQVAKPPLGPLARLLPQLVDRDAWIAGNEERASGIRPDGLDASGQALVGRITPSARTVRPSSPRGGSATEHGMGISGRPSPATPKDQRAAPPRNGERRHGRAREERAPETRAACRAPRQEVVRGRARAAVENTEQEPVDYGNGQKPARKSTTSAGARARWRPANGYSSD